SGVVPSQAEIQGQVRRGLEVIFKEGARIALVPCTTVRVWNPSRVSSVGNAKALGHRSKRTCEVRKEVRRQRLVLSDKPGNVGNALHGGIAGTQRYRRYEVVIDVE